MLLDDAAIPDPFWVFVDQTNVMTWNNFNLVGALGSTSLTNPSADSSNDLLLYVRNEKAVPGFISPFVLSSLSTWGVELDAEYTRRLIAADNPSRLSSVYAFGSEADCRTASTLYGWDFGEVRPLRLDRSIEYRVAKANMNIVSLARLAYARGGLEAESREALWGAYWSGAESVELELSAPPPELGRRIPSGCLWEYLIHGRLLRIGQRES